LQNSLFTYTFFNLFGINDRGDWSLGDTGVGTITGYEASTGTYAGSDNCDNNTRCDTEKYVADVNASNGGVGLCGATDRRLSNKNELLSLVEDACTVEANNNASAWVVAFLRGQVDALNKSGSYYARLVRSSQ